MADRGLETTASCQPSATKHLGCGARGQTQPLTASNSLCPNPDKRTWQRGLRSSPTTLPNQPLSLHSPPLVVLNVTQRRVQLEMVRERAVAPNFIKVFIAVSQLLQMSKSSSPVCFEFLLRVPVLLCS